MLRRLPAEFGLEAAAGVAGAGGDDALHGTQLGLLVCQK
jgi:hypothetical protein